MCHLERALFAFVDGDSEVRGEVPGGMYTVRAYAAQHVFVAVRADPFEHKISTVAKKWPPNSHNPHTQAQAEIRTGREQHGRFHAQQQTTESAARHVFFVGFR